MGSIGTLIAATLVAVTYGWMPASSDDNGKSSVDAGYEYLVQIDAEDLRALADGRVSSLSSVTPEGMKSIDRVRIVFGKGNLPRQLTAIDRTSPKRLSKLSQTAVKHTVAKPIVSDWLPVRSEESKEESGQRHTVYQQPGYQNPGSLGETMQQGSKQLTDAIRSAPQDFGNYINQTGRDFSQGTQGVVGGAMGGLRDSVQAGATGMGNVANDALNYGNDPYFNQRRQGQNNSQGSQPSGTAAGAGQTYKPYNYNDQPTLAGQTNSQDSHAGHNHQPNTNLNQQPVNNRTQGPTLPPPPATDNGIATTFGSGAANNDPGYRRNETNPNYDTYNNDLRDNDRRNETDRNYDYGDSYVNRRDESRMTPVARDSNPLPPLQEFSNRRDETNREPSQSQYDAWRTPTVDSRRPTPPDFGTPSSFGTPPSNTQQPVNQTAGYANQGQNQGAPSEAQSWGNGSNNGNASNYNQGNSQNNGFANNSNQQNASLVGNPLNNPWLMVFLLGSLAGNVYVATSYLDVRNKYRAALRRGPSGYQHGV